MSQLHDELNIANAICTTAAIWSINNKSLMGMTVHWVSPDLKRKSNALTCCWFTSSHTYDRIAEVICDEHNFHDLEFGKIVTTVTDTASNFAKIFSNYMVDEDDLELIGEEIKEEKAETDEELASGNGNSIQSQQIQTEIVVQEVGKILKNADVPSVQLQLPLIPDVSATA